ncbi:MAG TPA: NAD-dependent epimerase/dehydratase family protein [Solirubrobacterales bacterium]|nr:NAD-dependent epimerase/dehydratase family protein [Solirubrobacterales bacterium]
MKYVITGGSGYIGSRLTELLTGRDETERIVDVDVRPPDVPWPKTEYVRGDVRDRAAMRELLERERPDALVHLAFLLNPIRDEARMYDIDVNGTLAVLEAAWAAGVGQVLVTSSASAYGAFPDNPVPIAEDHPVRGQPDFSYARDKAEADRVCQLWAADHPDRVMTIVRPTIVFGPNVDNYISRGWENSSFIPVMDGVEADLQLVHEDDVVSAIAGLLDAKEGGAFNLAADGLMTWRESAELIGMKVREMKFQTVYRIYSWAWRLHAPRIESPPGNLHFLRHPWVVSNEKLKHAIGWEPAHETRGVFEETMRAKGLLEGRAEPAATLRAAGA